MTSVFKAYKTYFILAGIVLLFLVLRIPAIHRPYHQDEYKWPIIVNPALTAEGGIPHPPVGEFIYRELGKLVGYDNFRIIPLVFSFLNLLLIFALAKKIRDEKFGILAAGLFAMSAYSVIASLMVDTDGAIMPFFLLISLYSYYSLRQKYFKIDPSSYKWVVLLVISVCLGFLTKASFIIGIGAMVIDFAFEKKIFDDKNKLLKYAGYVAIGIMGLGLVLVASSYVFPFFRLDWSIKYWEHFMRLGGRGWLQTIIQFVKGIFYLSPAFVLLPLFSSKEDLKDLRPFLLFIGLGLFFYLILFDFSQGALDRYLQFLILPLCMLLASVLHSNLASIRREFMDRASIIAASLLSLVFVVLLFVHQYVPPLYPKTEWIERTLSFKWNFLFPFSGGSGPLTFYVSFLFIALIWIISVVFVFSGLISKTRKVGVVLAVLMFSFIYNAVFTEEYLLGKIYGSAPKVVFGSTEYIRNNSEIKKVVVYNDNGGYEVQKIGKYEKRLYTSPQFDINEKIKSINDFSGYYLEVDAPPIDPHSIYRKYLDSCKEVYKQSDKYINSRVYDCTKAPQIKK